MYDAIVIGAGPAGISASLYLKRSNLNVLVLYCGKSELEKAHKIDNFYGFVGGIEGSELYENGIKQAKELGVNVIEKEVIDIEITENNMFKVKTSDEKYESISVIIATGNKRVKPNIKGINEFEGKGISYCAICDGFFYRNKNVVVIGNGEFAVSEANDLKNIANNVKILSNGLDAPNTDEYEVITQKIKEIRGEERAEQIEFEDGKTIDVDGIFIAQGIAGGIDFAKKIGVLSNNDNLVVNENMETNIKGLYACGNLTGGLLQVNKAAYEGAKAGLTAVSYIKEVKNECFKDNKRKF